MIQVFSSGGGTQSTAICALIVQGKLPKPDFIVIADTSRECSSTWRYLDDVVGPELAKVGLEVHRIGHEWASVPVHGRDFLNHNGNTMIIPAWTNKKTHGKLSGFCSARWKVEVIDRFLSKQFKLTRSKYRKWIGFSLDEWRRAQRMMAGEEGRKGLIWLPLIEQLHLKRYESIKIVENMGWPTPPRSRCWMCPNQSDYEWLDVKKNYPHNFQDAAEFEQAVQQVDPWAWLHKDCVPLNKVKFASDQDGIFDAGMYCGSGVCYI